MENMQSFYSKLERCYGNAEADKFFVARDHPHKDGGSKQYTSFKSAEEFINYQRGTKKKDRNFYEIIRGEDARYEYYDIDGWDLNKYPTPRAFFNMCFFPARRALNISGSLVNLTDFVVMQACKYDENDILIKGSLHIVNKNLAFENQEILKIYMKEASIFFIDQYPDLKIDLAVYSKNQCFRLEGNTKKGQMRFFERPSWSVFSPKKGENSIRDGYITVDVDPSLFWDESKERLEKIEKEKRERLETLKNIKVETSVDFFDQVVEEIQEGRNEKNDPTTHGKLAYVDWRYFCIATLASYGFEFLEKNFEVIYSLYRNAGSDAEMHLQLNSWRSFNFKQDPNQFFLSFKDERGKGDKAKYPTIIHTEKWVSPINPKEKVYILKAYMGKGKTTQICDYLNRNKGKTCIFLTSRKTFASSLFSTLSRNCSGRDWLMYLNKKRKEIDDSTNLIVQVESLFKVKNNYDIVIMDECESLLYQMTSLGTHKDNIYSNIEALKRLLSNAQQVIYADAFVSKRTFDFIEGGREKKYEYHKYISKPEKREAIRFSTKDSFLLNLISDLNIGKKIFLFSTSVNKLQNWIIVKIEASLKKKLKIYTGGNLKKLENVNEDWIQYDLIGTTSCITIGCNFDVKDYFDRIYIYASASSRNLVRDIFQAHMRVRYIRDNKLCFFIDPRPIGFNTASGINEMEIEKSIDFRSELMKGKYKDNFITIEDDIKRLFINNKVEHNLSIICLEKVFFQYLERCGYQTKTGADIFEEKELRDENKIDLKMFKYEEIKELTYSELCKLKEKQKKDGLEEIEKLQVEKYYFQIVIDDVGEDKAGILWKLYCDYGKSKFKSIAFQKSPHSIEQLTSISGRACFWTDNYLLRLETIKNVCLTLGLKNTGELRSVERRELERKVGEILEMKEKIKNIFDLRDRGEKDEEKKGKENDLKNAISLVNEVLSRVGYTVLKKNKTRKREKVNGVIVDTTDFSIQSIVDIDVFESIRPYKLKRFDDEIDDNLDS